MKNLNKAAELIVKYTQGHINLFRLAGGHNKIQRQNIMLFLTGTKLPKAKCGINAIEAALKTEFNIPPMCGFEIDREIEGNILTIWHDLKVREL